MRKDVKLGFTIGGVLLAVLIVYVLVISSGPPQHRNDVSLVKPELTPADNGGPGASGKQTGEAAGAPKSSTSDRDVDAAKIDPFKPTIPDSTAGHANGSDAPKPQQPSGGGEDKWAAALNTGKVPAEQLPLLMTKTPSATDARNGGNGGTGTAANPGTSDPSATPANVQGALNGSDSATAPPAGPSVAAGGESIASQILGSTASTQPVNTTSGSAAAGARTHVVQRGESFATIAAAVYGNSAYYPHLLRANPNVDPKKLKPGMTVNIPDPAEVVAAHNASSSSASSDSSGTAGANGMSGISTGATGAGNSASSVGRAASGNAAAQTLDEKSQYRVQASDSLYKISLKLYGKADRVDKLYELNKDVIGANPAHLKAGMVLRLPDPPTSSNSATAAR